MRRFGALLAVAVLMAAGCAWGQSADKVLAQLDAAAAKFQSAEADVQWDQYMKVVDEHDQQSGKIYFDRKGGATQMAAHIDKPAPVLAIYKDGQLFYYQPNIDQLTVFKAGQNGAQFQSFLTLGFGGSGKDLAANWDVANLGTEAVGGAQTVKLDLKPKQQSVQNMFTHVTIWVDPVEGVSYRQQYFEPSGDVKTVVYTNIRYNKRVAESAFGTPKTKNPIAYK